MHAQAAPRYALGAFQYKTGSKEADEIYARIPPTTEILLTHTPPFETCDVTRRGKNAGCPMLAARLATLEQCKLHVFGHIHEGFGFAVRPQSETDCQRISVNAAMPDNMQAVIVDLLN
jgi:Icc-related predicted phosphoesterase